jgi:hypothetical protein
MRKLLTGLALATALVATPALADTISFKAAKVLIDVPDEWHSSTDSGTITLADKHENVAVSFTAVDAGAVKAAAKYVKRQLEKKIDKLTLTDPEHTTVNGMDGVLVKGDGFLNGVNIDLAIIILDTPSDSNDLLVFAIGEDAKLAKHMDEVQHIFHHLRPMN